MLGVCSPGTAAEELKQGLGLCQGSEVDGPCPQCSVPSWPSTGREEGGAVQAQWDPRSFATSWSRLNRAVWFSWQIRLAGASVPSSRRMPLFFVGVSPVRTMLLISFSLWREEGSRRRISSHYFLTTPVWCELLLDAVQWDWTGSFMEILYSAKVFSSALYWFFPLPE